MSRGLPSSEHPTFTFSIENRRQFLGNRHAACSRHGSGRTRTAKEGSAKKFEVILRPCLKAHGHKRLSIDCRTRSPYEQTPARANALVFLRIVSITLFWRTRLMSGAHDSVRNLLVRVIKSPARFRQSCTQGGPGLSPRSSASAGVLYPPKIDRPALHKWNLTCVGALLQCAKLNSPDDEDRRR